MEKNLRVSKNFVLNEKIMFSEELCDKVSVYVKCWNKVHPTGFLLSMQARCLIKIINKGVWSVTKKK